MDEQDTIRKPSSRFWQEDLRIEKEQTRIYIPKDDDVVISRDNKVIEKIYFEDEDTNYESLVREEERNTKKPERGNRNKHKNSHERREIEDEPEEADHFDDAPEVAEMPENERQIPENERQIPENESQIFENGRPQREKRKPSWWKDFILGDSEQCHMLTEINYLEDYLTEIMVEESTKDHLTIFNKTKNMLMDIKNAPKEKVCCLIKALYGLKQAGRQWYKKLDTELKHIGFKASEADPCVYVLEKRGAKLIIVIYVDDLLIAYSSPKILNEVKYLLNSKFELKDLGRPKRLISIDMSYK
ncbi:uncharacterized protein LOC134753779 [Cydia strobilella]|uniref:uncharacterized protein LOC134753779 n=1 Tax=Cydia strobilella TaxID=1100964 RepID=UPI00300477AA